MKKLMLSLFAAMAFSMAVHAAIEVHEFDTLEQEQQFKELGNTLRCPKCQNNTIADSNAELAVDLRLLLGGVVRHGSDAGLQGGDGRGQVGELGQSQSHLG